MGQQSGSQIFNLGKNYGIIEKNDYTSRILVKILHSKLNYNPNYTRIYGIKHDINYLIDITHNFLQVYQDFIKFLQGKQTLIMWYQQQIKIFHQQFGIPYKVDSFWHNYIDNSSILTVQCRLNLASSDPFQNFTDLRDYDGMYTVIHNDFPNYNILQQYTLDFKLFYVIIASTSDDKTKLDEYIHQEVRIQEIDYTEVAKIKLEQLKKREQQYSNSKGLLEVKNNIDKLLQFFQEKIQLNIVQNELVQEKVENDENSEIFIEYQDLKKQEELN